MQFIKKINKQHYRKQLKIKSLLKIKFEIALKHSLIAFKNVFYCIVTLKLTFVIFFSN